MALQESDIEFQDIPIHIWEGGEGYPILVLHGSGAGASTIGNFGRVIEPLAKRYKILAADLIRFGLSGRKSHEPFFDMDMWVDQADFLAQRLSESCPEPNKLLTPCRGRSTWRMQLAPSRPIRPPSAYRHSNLLCQSVATTD